ncbi:MAG TPA: GAF domain-containing sensor histidine kinase [Candidatus Baltobacteraceae bacterium]|nr:GAF domain-containing sensor histidine kinase [Candidatus Baltobacteraceae bacterium]
MLPLLCYGLLAAAWALDLVTPQLFVAAILLNAPIALSSLALRRELTTRLVVLAEIANAVTGYVNGAQAGYHWDAIALADRVLLAASFLLVGYLSIKTQEYAREAGESAGRARQVEIEKGLREATGRVRGSLNVDLVLRGVLRESMKLLAASSGLLIVRDSTLESPLRLSLQSGDGDVRYERRRLSSELTSLAERARDTGKAFRVTAEDALGRLTLESLEAREAVATVIIPGGEIDCVLVECAQGETPLVPDALAVLEAFAEQAGTALAQARVFTQLGEQNQEIVRQKDEIVRRGDVIRDIVYALAHDLRTPLAAADVTTKQALTGAYGELPERYVEILRATQAANSEERRIVETLLLVARYEAGEESTVRERVACEELVRRVVEDLEPVGEVKGVTMHAEILAHPLCVMGDAHEIRRALVNLVANAIEATPQDGHIEVRADRRDGSVAIAVEDSGYGIPPERRDALFQRFAGGSRVGAGTGLGLYIVRRIAEKHGGSVSYAPHDPRGSTFLLTLPFGER